MTLSLLVSLSVLCKATFPWSSNDKGMEKPRSFFDLPNLKIGVVPESNLRIKEIKLYGSEKWKKVQEGNAQRAKITDLREDVKPTKKYFGLRVKEQTVVFSKPPCLPGQKIDILGFCRNDFTSL